MKYAIARVIKVLTGGVLLVGVLLTSVSCTVKTGNYFFDDKDFRRFGTDCFDVWEFEMSSPRFLDGKVDIAGTLGLLRLDRHRDDYYDHDRHHHYHYFYETSTDLVDLGLTARFYPFEIFGIHPYIGVGGSWYWLGVTDKHGHSHDHYYDDDDYYDDVDRETISDGFYYHTVTGILIPLYKLPNKKRMTGVCWVLEHRFDFARKSDGYDLSGNKVMTGIGIRF